MRTHRPAFLSSTTAIRVLLLTTLASSVGCGAASYERTPSAAQAPRGGGVLRTSESVATGVRKDRAYDVEDDVTTSEQSVRSEVAAKAPAPAPPPPPPQQPAQANATQPPSPTSGTKPAETTAEGRDASMIVYTARVTMAVYQVDQGLDAVERIARDMGGYLALKRDREITIRVPRARFEPTLAAIDKIGDIVHRDVQAQDVTDEYVDLDVRIKNARAMQVRLKQLLDKAAVKEALEIEKELHRVTEELELLEGKMKLLRDKIAYSTVTVMFEPRGASVAATRVRLPFPWLGQLGLPSLLSLEESR